MGDAAFKPVPKESETNVKAVDGQTADRTSTPALGLVWFGASVSLAEILTGTFFAPLGLVRGLEAVLVGHVIGCVLFWLVAYASAKTGRTAMELARVSFGRHGASAFSGANVIQLVGWTAIMIASGAASAALLVPQLGFAGWCVVIGALIALWVALGSRTTSWLQPAAAVALFALTCVASVTVFGGDAQLTPAQADALSFGAAVELAAAMPLSWLPVVGDYTCRARKPLAGATAATATYFVGSCWMFVIGLGLALFAGSEDLGVVLAASGLGIVGILIVVFSTVTTTFLDARSAGESSHVIHQAADPRIFGVAAAVLGTVLAALAPVGNFEGFLYLIGSVFAPMAAVLCADVFILKTDLSQKPADIAGLLVWLAGFAFYRMSMSWDFVLGNTLVTVIVTALLTIAVRKLMCKKATR